MHYNIAHALQYCTCIIFAFCLICHPIMKEMVTVLSELHCHFFRFFFTQLTDIMMRDAIYPTASAYSSAP